MKAIEISEERRKERDIKVKDKVYMWISGDIVRIKERKLE